MSSAYDVVMVGGGLGGAGLGRLLARAGLRVLVLERTLEFHDRVRGEVLVPWGVAEAKRLGFDELLRPVGNDLRWWDFVLGGVTARRDIPATCLPGVAVLTYYHPEMQNILLQAAEDVGAEVRRGARVTGVKPGRRPGVVFQHEGRKREVQARPLAPTAAARRSGRGDASGSGATPSAGSLLGFSSRACARRRTCCSRRSCPGPGS